MMIIAKSTFKFKNIIQVCENIVKPLSNDIEGKKIFLQSLSEVIENFFAEAGKVDLIILIQFNIRKTISFKMNDKAESTRKKSNS